MSVRIVIVNTLSDSTTVAIGNRRVAIPAMGSLQYTVPVGTSLASNDGIITHNGRGGNPIAVREGGRYSIVPGQQGGAPTSPVKDIVDRILDQQCATYGWYQPEMPGQSPCEYNKYRDIIAMINGLPTSTINEVVVTDIPNQEPDRITMLEAAIIMRLPSLVARLLALGADPTFSTSDIPLITQLERGAPPDPDTRNIVEMLIRYGAPNPQPQQPCGYPGMMPPLPYDRF